MNHETRNIELTSVSNKFCVQCAYSKLHHLYENTKICVTLGYFIPIYSNEIPRLPEAIASETLWDAPQAPEIVRVRPLYELMMYTESSTPAIDFIPLEQISIPYRWK